MTSQFSQSLDRSLIGKLLGSIRTAKKHQASRRNMELARAALQRQSNGRPFKVQRIVRVEKCADRNAYREVLECGHAGRCPVFGPQRIQLALKGEPISRRCYECCASKEKTS